MKVLLISPFGYAIKQKSKEIKTILKKQKVAAFIDEVIAMPDDINKRLKGKQYDYCLPIQNITVMKSPLSESIFKENN